MGYTGYENLTDEEILVKLENAKRIQYNLEREQQHRKERIELEKYENIIGKIFYHKNNRILVKVTGVQENPNSNKVSYICKELVYNNTVGSRMMSLSDTIQFTLHYKVNHIKFDSPDWVSIDEARAEEIIGQWKSNVNHIKF